MASQSPDSSNSSIRTINDELLEDLEDITEVDLALLRDLLEDPKEEKREEDDRNNTTSGVAQSLEVQEFSWFNVMEMSTPSSLMDEINWCADECMEEMAGMVEYYFGEDNNIGDDEDSQLYYGGLSLDDIGYGCSLWEDSL